MASRLTLRVRRSSRDLAALPDTGDRALGDALWGRLCGALDKGRPHPALLVLREDRVEQFDLVQVRRVAGRGAPRLISALAAQLNKERASDVVCTALVGVLVLRGRGRPECPGAVVYVEWPDNRWWSAVAPLAAEGGLQWPEPQIRSAVDGWPRPGGVGGWFSTARRERLWLNLQPVVPEVVPDGQQGLGLVH